MQSQSGERVSPQTLYFKGSFLLSFLLFLLPSWEVPASRDPVVFPQCVVLAPRPSGGVAGSAPGRMHWGHRHLMLHHGPGCMRGRTTETHKGYVFGGAVAGCLELRCSSASPFLGNKLAVTSISQKCCCV
jgi:hypothetical protein